MLFLSFCNIDENKTNPFQFILTLELVVVIVPLLHLILVQLQAHHVNGILKLHKFHVVLLMGIDDIV